MKVVTNNNILCTIALAALHNVEDPEIGLNVVDLGLVYQVDFEEDNKSVYVAMTLTTQFCPMGEAITSAAQRALERAFPEFKISISIVFDPPWSAELISEEGQEYLNR